MAFLFYQHTIRHQFLKYRSYAAVQRSFPQHIIYAYRFYLSRFVAPNTIWIPCNNSGQMQHIDSTDGIQNVFSVLPILGSKRTKQLKCHLMLTHTIENKGQFQIFVRQGAGRTIERFHPFDYAYIITSIQQIKGIILHFLLFFPQISI